MKKEKFLKRIVILFITLLVFNFSAISIYAVENRMPDFRDAYLDRVTGESINYELYLDLESVTFKWDNYSDIDKLIFYRSENDGEYLKISEVNFNQCIYKDTTYDNKNCYIYMVEAEFKDGTSDIFAQVETYDEEVPEYIYIIIIIAVIIAFIFVIAEIIMLIIPREDKPREELKEHKAVSTLIWTALIWPVGVYKVIKYREENDKGFYIKWLLFLFTPMGLYVLWTKDTFGKKKKILLTVASLLPIAAGVIMWATYLMLIIAGI